jgi:hypothetical protein
MHGPADPLVPRLNTVAYCERLIDKEVRDGRRSKEPRSEALRRTQQFSQLFLLPGAGHCRGGSRPYTVEGDPFPPGSNHPAPPAQLSLRSSHSKNGSSTASHRIGSLRTT